MGKCEFKVNIISPEGERTLVCPKGTNLMELLRQNNIYIEAPCGGRGICGKCKVLILQGKVSMMGKREAGFLSSKEKDEGYRLACETLILGHTKLSMEDSRGGARILSQGGGYSIDPSPKIQKTLIRLEPPTTEDQRDDLSRVSSFLKIKKPHISLKLLKKLPALLRDSDFNVTAVYDGDEILSIEKGDTRDHLYGVAVDIGTTTLVLYLVDLRSGKQVDFISAVNDQKPFGGDLISRIQYTLETKDGLSTLGDIIRGQVSALIKDLAQRNHIPLDHIYNLVIGGNTVMTHIFMGISPEFIASTPFIPAFTRLDPIEASSLGLNLGRALRVFLLPNISAYVGGDVVAGILASAMDREEDLCLYIDIGTNGEIVLGNKEGMVCCSAAAGPAFEGANIRHGMSGVNGAINTLISDEGRLKFTTIGEGAPLGICGSGIVDALAFMLDFKIIDETGRILEREDIKSGGLWDLPQRIRETEGQKAFVIASKELSGTGEAIVISQRDIREIQLAKAAIAAGINILLKRMERDVSQIKKVYLAGGFGNYIDKTRAAKIGLIPPKLEDRIIAIGNGAGTGAKLALISKEYYQRANNLTSMIEYIELSTAPEFQDEYVDNMYFHGD